MRIQKYGHYLTMQDFVRFNRLSDLERGLFCEASPALQQLELHTWAITDWTFTVWNIQCGSPARDNDSEALAYQWLAARLWEEVEKMAFNGLCTPVPYRSPEQRAVVLDEWPVLHIGELILEQDEYFWTLSLPVKVTREGVLVPLNQMVGVT